MVPRGEKVGTITKPSRADTKIGTTKTRKAKMEREKEKLVRKVKTRGKEKARTRKEKEMIGTKKITITSLIIGITKIIGGPVIHGNKKTAGTTIAIGIAPIAGGINGVRTPSSRIKLHNRSHHRLQVDRRRVRRIRNTSTPVYKTFRTLPRLARYRLDRAKG